MLQCTWFTSLVLLWCVLYKGQLPFSSYARMTHATSSRKSYPQPIQTSSNDQQQVSSLSGSTETKGTYIKCINNCFECYLTVLYIRDHGSSLRYIKQKEQPHKAIITSKYLAKCSVLKHFRKVATDFF